MHRNAFTLIELLTVLAVTAVLGAILLPLLRAGRAAAQSVKCQSNLRQIGVGLTQFITENANVLPNSAYGNVASETDSAFNYKWMDVIFPYINKEEVFLCPSDLEAKYRSQQNLVAGTTSKDYGSYGMNGAYRSPGDGQTPPRSSVKTPPTSSDYVVSRLQLAEPSSTVWVTDTNNREEVNGSYGISWADAGANPSITAGPPRQLEKVIERHNKTANVLFCDGHVENRSLESLSIRKTLADGKEILPLFTIEAD